MKKKQMLQNKQQFLIDKQCMQFEDLQTHSRNFRVLSDLINFLLQKIFVKRKAAEFKEKDCIDSSF